MMVRELLNIATQRLREAGVETPILDAEVMLAKASYLSRIKLLAHPELELPDDVTRQFRAWVGRRSHREPLAYIVEEREFYGLCFEMTPAVLIPRPETEILVETALNLLANIRAPLVAEIGLGSGAVAISLAKVRPDASVYGTESSASALQVACRNAERIGVQDRVHFFMGDLLEPLAGMTFDMIVSNPPYIPSGEIEGLEPDVAKYEPRRALDGGRDGLWYYRRLAADAPGCLKSGGFLAIEIGAGQAETVMGLLRAKSFVNAWSTCDYSGIERVIVGEKGSG